MKRRTFLRSTAAAAAAVSLPQPVWAGRRYRPLRRPPPDLEAVTGDGRVVMLSGRDVAELDASLFGRVLLPEDEGYDRARRILNPSFDKYPALIVQVTGTADVAAAVDFARENGGLLLAVKCGGHSASGKSTCDRGMMIDLSGFRAVRVDPEARRARVTGGCLLGHVDHETMAHGLATPLGTVSHTGVGGLVTGGGFGRLARRFGLAVDNVTAVDVVTADGELRHASEDENPDLFWGVRGGGGNFGVVTSFELRLHPMRRQVVGGRILFPLSKARDLLGFYADHGPAAPDELYLDYIMVVPSGGDEGVAGFSVCFSGPEREAERALAPLRRLGTPVADEIRSMDYVELQRSGDIDDPRGQASYLKSGFIGELPADLVSAIVDGFEGHPQRTTIVAFQHSGGAIGRVPSAATAFPQRGAMAILLCGVDWRYRNDRSRHVAWIRDYWSGLEPFTRGFYLNDEGVDRSAAEIRDAYRRNHDRLVEVKSAYDPTNLFRLNANVRPTA